MPTTPPPDNRMESKAQKLWTVVKGSIEGTVARPCSHLQQRVNLGILGKLPSVCLDTVPFEAGTIHCDATCARHINVLGSLQQISRIMQQKDIAPSLLPYLLKVGQAYFAKSGVSPWDGAPPEGLAEMLAEGRRYGSGPNFTVSGLHGHHHSLSDQEVQTLDVSAAAGVLQQCVSDSVEDGILRLFHVTLEPGRFWADSREAVKIPEVAEWVKVLSERCPMLWFCTDPDTAQLIYGSLCPHDVEADTVGINLVNLLDLFAMSAPAAIDALSEAGSDPSRTESLVAQAAIYKDLWVREWEATDVEHRILRELDSAIGQVEARDLRRTIDEQKSLLAQNIKEKLLESYNDGQIHNPAFGPFDGLYFHILTFPCGPENAQRYFVENYGSYASYLQGSATGGLEFAELLGARVFCQVVVCSECPYEFAIAIALWDLQSSQVLQLPTVFGGNQIKPLRK